jgi:hypothetical protein
MAIPKPIAVKDLQSKSQYTRDAILLLFACNCLDILPFGTSFKGVGGFIWRPSLSQNPILPPIGSL